MEHSYKNLVVYAKSKDLVKQVYALLKMFPKEEQYALCDQLRRAVISVPSNIAEGMGRSSNKERTHFVEIAYGSLMETNCQLEIASELNYISEEEYNNIDKEIDTIARMLSGLKQSLSSLDTRHSS